MWRLINVSIVKDISHKQHKDFYLQKGGDGMALTNDDLQAIAQLIQPLKDDMQDMKDDMQGMKDDMQNMKNQLLKRLLKQEMLLIMLLQKKKKWKQTENYLKLLVAYLL